MSEGNERDLTNATPGAAQESPQQEAQAQPDQPEEGAQSPAEGAPRHSKKKRRKQRGALAGLAVVLVALLVVLGVVAGYGLGRSQRGGQDVSAEPSAEAQEVPPYDAFTEAMTNDNQEALNALSGAGDPVDEDAGALLGEEGFFAGGEAGEAPESVIVAEYGDGQRLMSDEVIETYNEELSSYILSGYSEAEVAETVLDDVLRTMVSQRVLEQHAREMGIYELTDDDRAEIDAQAQQRYEEYLAYCLAHEVNTEGMTEEEATGAAKAHLLEHSGVTLDSLRAELEAGWWERKLYDALTGDVSVDDEQVQAAYESRLEEQRRSFTQYPDDYEFRQHSGGEIILYNPPGYRAVKMLLIGFDDEEARMAVFALTDELSLFGEEGGGADEQQRRSTLDAYYAGPEQRAREALEALRGGADMDELILSIGSDEGMKDERLRRQGYSVCADSMLWSEGFVQAAMGLENVGDYSEPVRMDEGVCILQYLGDVPEGPVPLDDVREELTQEVLSAEREAAYSSRVQTWMDEANPRYYPERMQ